MKITGIELEEKDILYILTDAVETRAIDYWAQIQKFKRTKSVVDEIKNCIYEINIKELNIEETDYVIPHKITRETIIKGAELIVTGKVDASRIRNMILDDDIDSDGTDCIIQAGLFGEIKYG